MVRNRSRVLFFVLSISIFVLNGCAVTDVSLPRKDCNGKPVLRHEGHIIVCGEKAFDVSPRLLLKLPPADREKMKREVDDLLFVNKDAKRGIEDLSDSKVVNLPDYRATLIDLEMISRYLCDEERVLCRWVRKPDIQDDNRCLSWEKDCGGMIMLSKATFDAQSLLAQYPLDVELYGKQLRIIRGVVLALCKKNQFCSSQ